MSEVDQEAPSLDVFGPRAVVYVASGRCFCEHALHPCADLQYASPNAAHVYGEERPLTHWCYEVSGPVCSECAYVCLAEWSRQMPGNVVELPADLVARASRWS